MIKVFIVVADSSRGENVEKEDIETLLKGEALYLYETSFEVKELK